VLVPPEDDVERVDAAIFGELCRGGLSDATRAEVRAVIARLADRGVDAVALSCTELELLLRPEDPPVPLLPSARLHVTAAVDAALAPSARVV
jgi:aspartate racemase